MLSILSRMNPAICLGVGSTVYEDDVVEAKNTPNDSSNSPQEEASNNNGSTKHNIVSNDRQSSFNCISGPNCSSKYQPNDKAEPLLLSSDVALQSLNRTVPTLLDCISKSPPTILPSNDTVSQKAKKKLIREYNTKRTSSLEKLYELTRKGKEHNRVPLVNTEQWDVIGVLASSLLISTEEDKSDNTTNKQKSNKGKLSLDEDQRLILWTLNNLSVPYENKGVIALGEHSSKLMHGLTLIMQLNQPESYLCCICLLNLTFHADAIRPVTFYVPSSYGDGKPPYSPTKRSRSVTSSKLHNSSNNPLARLRSIKMKGRSANGKDLWSEGARISEICSQVLGNSSSLIRVIERMLMTNAPFLLSKVQSVQGEAIRWGCGFVRNVTESSTPEDEGKGNDSLNGSTGRQGHISNECIEEICLLISQTEIPRLMVQFVKDSSQPTVKWTKDSLEDICLGAMCNIAQWQPSQEALKRAGALQCLEKIESLPGIHGYRARAIRVSLGALPKHFG